MATDTTTELSLYDVLTPSQRRRFARLMRLIELGDHTETLYDDVEALRARAARGQSIKIRQVF